MEKLFLVFKKDSFNYCHLCVLLMVMKRPAKGNLYLRDERTLKNLKGWEKI
jgi:hypothetical protein